MILTVTLNAALDTTYRLSELHLHASNRVTVTQQAGGKGVNVARVLAALGHTATVTGLVGGAAGRAVRADLARAGLPDELVQVTGETRRTVAVADDRDTTMLLEPGPEVSPREWQRFLAHYEHLLPGASVAVLSGSLPPGLPIGAYRSLVERARSHGVPAVLDADGPALLAALPARPAVVKPNAAELAAATGTRNPVEGAERLRAAGAEAVVASLGPDGLLALTAQGCWRARPAEALAGNPTGAGDSAVAALALGLADGAPWPDRLRRAAALSAATVLAPQAGRFDPDVYQHLLNLVRIEDLDPAQPQGEPCRWSEPERSSRPQPEAGSASARSTSSSLSTPRPSSPVPRPPGYR
ncbi:1-phosphofructokinase family hexose kinase [Kitasatospora sp. CM 4170]|uniref:1-phosphofructokinase family hexose kinase n=1 Tax=Kitasatospora aburaviensis TaxID=67265 RepID=A0ABW1EVG3_9ACTN|nr:1-phosphofructokinase family hexose kinase [Kitasatospora sp. CM 4170]WNM49607.1 1-phosphofructokinase family hexose kinase [Kitasatospora sp. CM 4170]